MLPRSAKKAGQLLFFSAQNFKKAAQNLSKCFQRPEKSPLTIVFGFEVAFKQQMTIDSDTLTVSRNNTKGASILPPVIA